MITFETLIHEINVWTDNNDKGADRPWLDQVDEINRKLEALEISIDSEKGATVEEMMAMGNALMALLVLCRQRKYQADTCLNMAFNKVKNQTKTEKE